MNGLRRIKNYTKLSNGVNRATKEYTWARFVLVVEATDLPGNTSTTTLEGEI